MFQSILTAVIAIGVIGLSLGIALSIASKVFAVKTNPKIVEAGAAGIPDPYRGETVKAWIVLSPGETMTEDEVKSWCKERLAAFKVPTHMEFRDELPKTTVGKILRRELVRQHNEASK